MFATSTRFYYGGTTEMEQTDNMEGSFGTGRWTDEEHDRFLEGIKIYNRNWKKLAAYVKTRTSVQIRTHAQKYFDKLEKSSHGNFYGNRNYFERDNKRDRSEIDCDIDRSFYKRHHPLEPADFLKFNLMTSNSKENLGILGKSASISPHNDIDVCNFSDRDNDNIISGKLDNFNHSNGSDAINTNLIVGIQLEVSCPESCSASVSSVVTIPMSVRTLLLRNENLGYCDDNDNISLHDFSSGCFNVGTSGMSSLSSSTSCAASVTSRSSEDTSQHSVNTCSSSSSSTLPHQHLIGEEDDIIRMNNMDIEDENVKKCLGSTQHQHHLYGISSEGYDDGEEEVGDENGYIMDDHDEMFNCHFFDDEVFLQTL